MNKHLFYVIALLLAIFPLYTIFFSQLDPMLQRGIPLCIAYILIILKNPSGSKPWNRMVDYTIILMNIVAFGYMFINSEDIIKRAGLLSDMEIFLGFLGLLLTLEATRRTVGNALPIIGIAAILYARFGDSISGVLGNPGYSFSRIVYALWYSLDGVFGFAIGVMVRLVIVFIIFGAIFNKSGAGKFITDLGMAVSGRLPSGPALSSVVASSLFGTISGSPIANVVTTGTFTIPLMRKAGYSAEFAGAVEATASTGGQLMPPVMGAAAFLMAETTATPYSKLILMAALPAVLYYVGVGASVHLMAMKLRLDRIEVESPSWASLLKNSYKFIVPLAVLLYFLFNGFSVGRSASYAIFATIAVMIIAMKKDFNVKVIADSFSEGATTSLSLWAAMGCVGIIVGIVGMTGIGGKVAELVLRVSGGSLFIALFLTMVASLILGMGLPTSACYLLLALIVAPSLEQLGIPLMAAHFFIFYFGIISAITPPVALASYAAASLSKADIMRTGYWGVILGFPGFIVPYIFVYQPSLIGIGTLPEIVWSALTAVLAIVCFAMGAMGYSFKDLNKAQRAVLIVAAILLIVPELMSDVIGLGLAAVALIIQFMQSRKGLRVNQQS